MFIVKVFVGGALGLIGMVFIIDRIYGDVPLPNNYSPASAAQPVDPAEEKQRMCGAEGETHAEVMAESYVRQHLKAPSTAEFPGIFERAKVSYDGKCNFVVESWFDAQNSFGTKLRTNYKLSLTYVGGEQGSWLVTNASYD